MEQKAVDYSYRSIWLMAYPILISLIMEQMIGITDTAFLDGSVKWNWVLQPLPEYTIWPFS